MVNVKNTALLRICSLMLIIALFLGFMALFPIRASAETVFDFSSFANAVDNSQNGTLNGLPIVNGSNTYASIYGTMSSDSNLCTIVYYSLMYQGQVYFLYTNDTSHYVPFFSYRLDKFETTKAKDGNDDIQIAYYYALNNTSEYHPAPWFYSRTKTVLTYEDLSPDNIKVGSVEYEGYNNPRHSVEPVVTQDGNFVKMYTTSGDYLVSVCDVNGNLVDLSTLNIEQCRIVPFMVNNINRSQLSSFRNFDFMKNCFVDDSGYVSSSPDYNESNARFTSITYTSTSESAIENTLDSLYQRYEDAEGKFQVQYGNNVNKTVTAYSFGMTGYASKNIGEDPLYIRMQETNGGKNVNLNDYFFEKLNASNSNYNISFDYFNGTNSSQNVTIKIGMFEYTQSALTFFVYPYWWPMGYAFRQNYYFTKNWDMFTTAQMQNIPSNSTMKCKFDLRGACDVRNNSFYIISILEGSKVLDTCIVKVSNGDTSNTYYNKSDNEADTEIYIGSGHTDYDKPVDNDYYTPDTPIHTPIDFNNINMNDVFNEISEMSGSLGNFFTAVYNIIPIQIMSLLIAFIAVAIILRVLGR